MFNLFSKLFSFSLDPYHWIVFLVFLGLIAKKIKTRKIVLVSSVFVYLIFGNPYLQNLAYKGLEVKPVFQTEIERAYEYGVLLGGGFVSLDENFPDRIVFNERANRLTEALELFYSGKIKNLIISGGAGGIGRIKNVEAMHAKSFLQEIHFPDSCVIIDAKSINTFENAIHVKAILDSLQYTDKILLITSAMHMQRAEATFKKQGINIDVYPADYKQKAKFEYLDYIFPNVITLSKWQSIFREWVGYKVYGMKGYL